MFWVAGVSLFASTALAQGPVTYTVLPTKSEIVWRGHKEVGDSHFGTVKIATGSVTVAGNELTNLEIVIDMTSIANTDVKDASYNKKLVDHLASADFFKTDEFKTAEFKMDTSKKSKIEKGAASVAGKLTIRGKTQDFSFKLGGIKTSPSQAEATGKIQFDRTQFDVKYNSSSFPDLFKVAKDKIIKNEVDIEFKIAAEKK